MQTALYCSSGSVPYSGLHHYALNVPLYTHFTSPIRRYADIIVHRLLAASLENTPCPTERGMLDKICANCNSRKMSSRKAQDQSDFIYLCILLQVPRQADAYILGLGEKSMELYIPEYDLERRIYISEIVDEDGEKPKILYNSKEKELRLTFKQKDGSKNESILRLFSIVRIEVGKIIDKIPLDLYIKLVVPVQIRTAMGDTPVVTTSTTQDLLADNDM